MRLDPKKGHLIAILCSDAVEKDAERCNDILAGVQPNLPETPVAIGRSGDRFISAPEEADPEILRAIKPIKLQHDLSILFDQDGHDHLLVHFEAQPNSDCDYRRFKDIRHKTVSSKWLWSVDLRFPLTLDPESYIAAARLRFGAGFICKPISCRLCNRPFDGNGTHVLCCAPCEGTRGHTEIRNVVFHVTRMADTTAERDVSGLRDTAPGRRPADIFASAVIPSLFSPVGIGVAAPHAIHAGEDCCETMRLRKIYNYHEYLLDFRLQGINYIPLVWSWWGRGHEETTKILRQFARSAA